MKFLEYVKKPSMPNPVKSMPNPALDISSATAQVALVLLKALVILSDANAKERAVEQDQVNR